MAALLDAALADDEVARALEAKGNSAIAGSTHGSPGRVGAGAASSPVASSGSNRRQARIIDVTVR